MDRIDSKKIRFPKSKKRRIIKKFWKRTGCLPVIFCGKKDGLYWYKARLF
jgi:hypothetical protein